MSKNEQNKMKRQDLNLIKDIKADWPRKSLYKLVDNNRKVTYGIVQPGLFSRARARTLFRVDNKIEEPYKRARVREGDLLITIVGYTGTVALVPKWLEGANITQTTARVSFDPKCSLNKFYYYFFQSNFGRKIIKKYEKGLAQPGLNLADIEKFIIPAPPLNEQKKIADILQTVDITIGKKKELIEKYKMIKQGLLIDLFSKKKWKKILLGELVSFEYGKGLSEENRSGQGFPVYGSNGIVGYHNQSFINESGIIVGRKGTAGAVSFSDRPFWPIDTTYYINRKKELDLKFTYYFLSTLELERLEASTGVPGLNRHDAYKIEAVDVPLKNQLEIVSFLSKMDCCIDAEHNFLEKLIKIKTGLIQDLFTGKVGVHYNE